MDPNIQLESYFSVLLQFLSKEISKVVHFLCFLWKIMKWWISEVWVTSPSEASVTHYVCRTLLGVIPIWSSMSVGSLEVRCHGCFHVEEEEGRWWSLCFWGEQEGLKCLLIHVLMSAVPLFNITKAFGPDCHNNSTWPSAGHDSVRGINPEYWRPAGCQPELGWGPALPVCVCVWERWTWSCIIIVMKNLEPHNHFLPSAVDLGIIWGESGSHSYALFHLFSKLKKQTNQKKSPTWVSQFLLF